MQLTFKQYLIERAMYPLQWKEGTGADFEWKMAEYTSDSGDNVLVKFYHNEDDLIPGWAWEIDALINGHYEVNKENPPKQTISLVSSILHAVDTFVNKVNPPTIVFQANNEQLCALVAKRLSKLYNVRTFHDPGLIYVLTHK